MHKTWNRKLATPGHIQLRKSQRLVTNQQLLLCGLCWASFLSEDQSYTGPAPRPQPHGVPFRAGAVVSLSLLRLSHWTGPRMLCFGPPLSQLPTQRPRSQHEQRGCSVTWCPLRPTGALQEQVHFPRFTSIFSDSNESTTASDVTVAAACLSHDCLCKNGAQGVDQDLAWGPLHLFASLRLRPP